MVWVGVVCLFFFLLKKEDYISTVATVLIIDDYMHICMLMYILIYIFIDIDIVIIYLPKEKNGY